VAVVDGPVEITVVPGRFELEVVELVDVLLEPRYVCQYVMTSVAHCMLRHTA
jgi:hypothetical protein